MEIRYASSNKDAKKYDTERLREEFLIQGLFKSDDLKLVYSHYDRIIAGSACPVKSELKLEAGKEIGAEYFLERRELGIINIGGAGTVILDGEVHELGSRDGLYVGMGVKEVSFRSIDSKNPAKFYLNSGPAHRSYPTVKIDINKANSVKLGEAKSLNVRTIYQYVHPAVCESCQLVMGMTMLEEGSVWNTMPAHTHDRRMEVYVYFDMEEETRVFHMMGEPTETRHIIMKNEEAALSPSWSIHSGVGTGRYTFIWGMVGENQTFTDMDHVDMDNLR
ncbi:5-dehydro-4-deoxy-D-glucuronate isomerase [Ilyobacter polytropus]|uniref:4-deoxy-L-threo-5-hexosulose-uronate ketol-isomerase n=1 Tax=Ilyobacter polytropus (strain ATCC 51220 / DSM 2926 / LMG 16218 / CuHBu1) TaxID=572544 RepID=E3HE51_ILYPC|nr:5-dehydro-4-deoxy-D-glucuronate isomerase [Ilyobacter polytropus]ADO84663.1 4-deoxy-L-threo-5-hexulose uronate isomerase [Ilyobacter polytropus DSM 2926]